jgi:fluoroacetyl-CoA thioesterase
MSGQLKVGMVRGITVKTEKEHTAQYFYENLPNVFATSFLAGFMERVSAELTNEHIEADEQSVGISMDLKHSASTPLGMEVRVKTEVTAVDGAKLTFKL